MPLGSQLHPPTIQTRKQLPLKSSVISKSSFANKKVAIRETKEKAHLRMETQMQTGLKMAIKAENSQQLKQLLTVFWQGH